MARIVFFIENPPGPIGGIERYCLKICQYAKRHEIIPVWLGAESVPSRFSFMQKRLAYPQDIKRHLQAIAPSLVHVKGFSSFAAMMAIRASWELKIPLIYSPTYNPFWAHNRPLLANLFFQGIAKAQIHKVNCIICSSTAEQIFMSHHFSHLKQEIHLLPEGQDIDFPTTQIPLRRDLERCIFIGRNDHNKGLALLLSNLAERFHLTIVTPKPMFTSRSNTRLLIAPDQQIIQEALLSSSFLLAPSAYESFHLAALEGMRLGVLPMLGEHVGLRDFLAPECGALLDRKHPEQWNQAILDYQHRLFNIEASARQQAFQCAEQLTWQNHVLALEKIYQQWL